MAAKYLLRFDDVCPTMDWDAWAEVEELLAIHNVKPLMSIVPDNRDPSLQVMEARADFWEMVKGWRLRGWSLGMHGYQHVFLSGDPGLIGREPRSEFAGEPLATQEDKLKAGLAVFREHRLVPEVFVAPAHSFDSNTLVALRRVGFKSLSDGLFLGPRTDDQGVVWLPQQLSRLAPRPFGLWTVSCHINDWTRDDRRRFADDLRSYAGSIIDVPSALDNASRRRPGFTDKLLERLGHRIWPGDPGKG